MTQDIKKKKIKNRTSSPMLAGFTLLETVVALTVITAAVVGPVSLITRGLIDSAFSKNKLVASNLAQEGIEAIRAARENNIICSFLTADPSLSWARGSDGSGTLFGTNKSVDASQSDAITCAGHVIQNPRVGNGCDTFLKIDPNGHYGYSGANTIFKRCVNIVQPAVGDGPIPASDIMDVEAVVTWFERGNDKIFTARERLYNWR